MVTEVALVVVTGLVVVVARLVTPASAGIRRTYWS
jgi:hypothetical protein